MESDGPLTCFPVARQGQVSDTKGRAPGEGKEAQGPRLQASSIHTAIRQRYHDRWKAEG